MTDEAQLSRRNLLRAGAVLAGMSAAVVQQADQPGDEPAMMPGGGGGDGGAGGTDGGSGDDGSTTLSVYGDGTYNDGVYGYP